MEKYRVLVPFIGSMGSISPFIVNESVSESKEDYALWVINNMRDHDGLKHLTKLPEGTKFEQLKKGEGWTNETNTKQR